MNTPLFRGLLLGFFTFSLLSNLGVAGHEPCVLSPHDFKEVKSTLHSRSSDRVYAGALKKDQCTYKAGTKFVIKVNPLALGIAEYVAAGLYQRILGKEAVSDTIWIQDADLGYGYIATQFVDSFRFFPGRYPSRDPKMITWEQLSFFDLFKNIWLKNGLSGKVLTQAPKKASSQVKPVIGIYIAALASEFMDDVDCEVGHNFALVEAPHDFHVTRYDFDGSLKYLEKLGYSKGRMGYGNQKNSQFLDMSSGIGSPYTPPSWRHMATNFLPTDIKDVDDVKMMAAFKQITSIDPEEIESLIASRTQAILDLQSDRALRESFNFKSSAKRETILAGIPLLISSTLLERQSDLKRMQDCLSFELAVRGNALERLAGLLSRWTPSDLSALQCASLYDDKLRRFEMPLMDMLSGYKNEALQALKRFMHNQNEL